MIDVIPTDNPTPKAILSDWLNPADDAIPVEPLGLMLDVSVEYRVRIPPDLGREGVGVEVGEKWASFVSSIDGLRTTGKEQSR